MDIYFISYLLSSTMYSVLGLKGSISISSLFTNIGEGKGSQSATLAAGLGPEASENLVRPVKNSPGPVKFTLNY